MQELHSFMLILWSKRQLHQLAKLLMQRFINPDSGNLIYQKMAPSMFFMVLPVETVVLPTQQVATHCGDNSEVMGRGKVNFFQWKPSFLWEFQSEHFDLEEQYSIQTNSLFIGVHRTFIFGRWGAISTCPFGYNASKELCAEGWCLTFSCDRLPLHEDHYGSSCEVPAPAPHETCKRWATFSWPGELPHWEPQLWCSYISPEVTWL